MSLSEVKWEIPASSAEATGELLLELERSDWSVYEDVIARRAWLIGLFPSRAAAHAAAQELEPLLGAAPLHPPEYRAMAESDWRDSYKRHFHAWQFGRLHWVPVWERETYSLPANHTALWLDPGLAFGTGNHETTRLCVERLVALAETEGTRGRVIDAGCGSGILALSAVRLGFAAVCGFDNDPEAVRVSRENAAMNGLTGAVRFYEGDLVSGLQGPPADVVLANILANVLIAFAPQLLAAVAPGGALVLSGILAREIDQVRSAFEAVAPGLRTDSRTLGEWSDLLIRR